MWDQELKAYYRQETGNNCSRLVENGTLFGCSYPFNIGNDKLKSKLTIVHNFYCGECKY